MQNTSLSIGLYAGTIRNRTQVTIHASNPEHLLFFKAPRGDDPEQNAGTILVSNREHLLGGGGGGGGGMGGL